MFPVYFLVWFLILPQSGCLGMFSWSYRDFKRWETIGECANGEQSPIDIVPSETVDYQGHGTLTFWSPRSIVQAVIHSNSHTWEVEWPDDVNSQAKLTHHGLEYFLKSFDFHSPSENTIDGQYYPMEAQFVHAARNGQMLVLSVMLDVGGEDNPYLDWYIWSKVQKGVAGSVREDVASPYLDFLPPVKSYYQWVGSLTTPPCKGNVTWISLHTPINMSQAQVVAFRKGINDTPRNKLYVDATFVPAGVEKWDSTLGINIRQTQPLGKRKVARYTVTDETHTETPLNHMRGWYILLFGFLVGLLCLCCGGCVYGCMNRELDGCECFDVEFQARKISRAFSSETGLDEDEESFASSLKSYREDF